MSAGTVPLIESRLHPAPPRRDDVPRPELVGQLPDATGGPRLSLVVAPPGWGKSSLLSHWLESVENLATAYVALDERDLDGRRALTYLGEGIRRAIPGLDAATMPEASASVWIDEALPAVVRRVMDTGTRLTVVLDDYHLVDGPGFHAIVAALVDELPAGCHVVIAGRVAPPFPVGRLRAQRELVEIGPDQLRFTREEAGSLLDRAFGVELADDDLARLTDRTEGWPSGISLAGISLVGEESPSEFVRRFGGSDQHVEEYLADEVLHRVEPDLRRFLLTTSVLGRFCPSLADAVTGSDDGEKRIEELIARNLFVVTLDQAEPWIRYHHLFREQLLASVPVDEAQGAHRRAAAWWLTNGRTAEAIDHLLAAGDTSGAAALVDDVAWQEMGRGRAVTVRRWIERLDEAALRERPLLYVVAASASDELGDTAAGRNWFDRLDADDLELDDRQLHAADVERCWSLLQSGDLEGAVEVGERILAGADRFGAVADDPDDPGVDLAQISLNAGFAFLISGRLDEAVETFEQVRQLPGSADRRAVAAALGMRAVAFWVAADDRFRSAAEESAEVLEGVEGSDTIYAIPPLLAAVLLDPVGSDQRTVDRLTALTELLRTPYPTAFARFGELEVLVARGDHETAAQAIAEIRDELERAEPSPVIEGRLAAIERDLDTTVSPAPDPSSLTDREIQVLKALTGSLTQREIARELYLSFNTVKSYSRTAFRKLGVNSRKDAVRRCRDLGVF